MMSFCRLILLFITFFTVFCCLCMAKQCSQKVSEKVSQATSIQMPMQQKYNVKCGAWGWGRCAKYRVAYKTSYTRQYIRVYELVPIECPECPDWEYAEELCQNCGNCKQCNCKPENSLSCDKRTGSCTCKEGWQGDKCEDKCPQGKYGVTCENNCTCAVNNTISCDHADGTCRCKPGWRGDICNETCDYWHFGHNCTERCTCDAINTIACDHEDGTCDCKPGWVGLLCNQTCPPERYGDRCQENCTCVTNSTERCDKVSGACECKAGWTGGNCDEIIDADIETPQRQGGPATSGGAIAGIVIAVLVIIGVIILIAAFAVLRLKKGDAKEKNKEVSLDQLNRTADKGDTGDSDDQFAYANVASSSDEGISSQPTPKPPVYAVVNKKRGKKTITPNDNEIDKANYVIDTSNSAHGYVADSTSLTYSGVDRTGKAYRPKPTQSGDEYAKLALATDDGYYVVDRTRRSDQSNVLAGQETEYDKLDTMGVVCGVKSGMSAEYAVAQSADK